MCERSKSTTFSYYEKVCTSWATFVREEVWGRRVVRRKLRARQIDRSIVMKIVMKMAIVQIAIAIVKAMENLQNAMQDRLTGPDSKLQL